MLGDPQITLMLSDLLDLSIGLRKTILLKVMAYYSERISIKIRKGKRHMERNQAQDFKCPLLCSLQQHIYSNVPSQWSFMNTHLSLPAKLRDVYEVLPTKKVKPSLDAQSFFWGSWKGKSGGISQILQGLTNFSHNGSPCIRNRALHFTPRM